MLLRSFDVFWWHLIRARFESCKVIPFKDSVGCPRSEALRRGPEFVNLNKVFIDTIYALVMLDTPRHVLKPLGKFMVTDF